MASRSAWVKAEERLGDDGSGRASMLLRPAMAERERRRKWAADARYSG